MYTTYFLPCNYFLLVRAFCTKPTKRLKLQPKHFPQLGFYILLCLAVHPTLNHQSDQYMSSHRLQSRPLTYYLTDLSVLFNCLLSHPLITKFSYIAVPPARLYIFAILTTRLFHTFYKTFVVYCSSII